VLIETTDLQFAEIAFAAGFASIRQFNDTIREVYALSPTELRGRRGGAHPSTGTVTMRLAVRTPYAGRDLLAFLTLRAVPGVETAGEGWYARTLALPHGTGTVRLDIGDHDEPGQTAFVLATFALDDLRDTTAGVERVRRLLDADCDPVAVDEVLGRDPLLGPLVAARPGLRVPGHVDGNEIAVRAVLGQQVTVKGARTLAERLVRKLGGPLAAPDGTLTHLFPSAEAVAGDDLSGIGLTGPRTRALRALAAAVAGGVVALEPGADRAETRRALLALPGIGPWTVEYVALRALGDPDAIPLTDLGLRQALRSLGAPDGTKALAARAERWRPWRSYAALHLWAHLASA
jgi:AraC family transcriptional regulator, regulatory protein of adaptative response / DNA-3-methyladenine glycosylase II